MVETTGWVDCDDGARLFVRHWSCGKPKALVHLVHGMAEHSARYRRLAEKLCSEGFDLWAGDLRGHGKTADDSVNDSGKGGLLGHCADKNGFFRVVEDLRILSRYIVEQSAQEQGQEPSSQAGPQASPLPFFIMGHSWGSFLVQAFIENPPTGLPLKGCILSGTRGPGGVEIRLGYPVLAFLALLNSSRRVSKLAFALSMGSYNKPFRPARTAMDWLSRDEQEVDAFISDPLCGQLCSSGFYRDMIGALGLLHRKKELAKIDRKLPIYIFCGSADPVGEMGLSPTRLVNIYRANGIGDLEFVIYPDARHEGLNETNREEVMEGLLSWLKRHLA
jgi:alpha-beta hydrolase superfamily lysophospholipase